VFVEVVALGTSGSYARFGQACSGYLFRSGGTNVLVDLGSGVLANLFRYVDPFRLDALVLTHLHADHVADLYPLRLYLRYNPGPRTAPLPVHAPAGALEALESVGPWSEPGELSEVFRFHDLPAPFEIGGMSFEFAPTRHVVPTFALVCRGAGRRIGFTADTSWDDSLPAFFQGCDVLLSEATYQGEGIDRIHMCAREAGRLAARAAVGRLWLTHLWPELDPAQSLAEAAREYPGSIALLQVHDRVGTE
jgi:ribonuclease BN (tRNA processing enzyme)